jgi:hypothetical protein
MTAAANGAAAPFGTGRLTPVRPSPQRADFLLAPADICVIAFSSDSTPENDHYELIARCLESIAAYTDPRKYRLLIGCNNLSPRALRLVNGFRDARGATARNGRSYPDAGGRLVFPKYPLMRSLYGLTRAPWVVWFDDDTYATAPDWLEGLEEAINRHPNAEQFGKKADTPMANPRPRWIETARWYNPAIIHEDVELGDGTARVVCDYIVGGFYAISRKAIRRCSIPDVRLFHNGGDWTTGLALRHQGFGIAHHTYGVAINRAPRRGMHLDHWSPPGEAARRQERRIAEERLLFESAVRGRSLGAVLAELRRCGAGQSGNSPVGEPGWRLASR